MYTAQPATEWRKRIAHGASRGIASARDLPSPSGAKDTTQPPLSPRWGSPVRTRQSPTARAVGYVLTPLSGLRHSTIIREEPYYPAYPEKKGSG